MQVQAPFVSGSSVKLSIFEFHKLGEVSSSEQIFVNQYSTKIVKLYLDVVSEVVSAKTKTISQTSLSKLNNRFFKVRVK